MRLPSALAGTFAFFAGVAACNAVMGIPEAGHLDIDGGASSSSSSSGNLTSSSSSSGTSSGNCEPGKKDCGGSCVDAEDPANGCGGKSCDPCDLPAAIAKCSAGACVVGGCKDGFKDCNGKAADGCEVDINNDLSNCGDCNNPCDGALTCKNGLCGCDQQIQCGLDTGGDNGGISCDENRLCTCSDMPCQQGAPCNADTQLCDF